MVIDEDKEKERFINIMNKIKIGSIIEVKRKFKVNSEIGIVHKIKNCKGGWSGHISCSYCIGQISLQKINPYKNIMPYTCFKRADSWNLDIIRIISEDTFIKEEEFTV